MSFDGMDPAAAAKFQMLVSRHPELVMTSGYRDPEHNARIGGAPNSWHTRGGGADFSIKGMTEAEQLAVARTAREIGLGGIGFEGDHLHFDTGPERMFGDDYTSGSVPEWAVAGMGGEYPVNPQMTQPLAQQQPLAQPQQQPRQFTAPKISNSINPEMFMRRNWS